MKTIGRKVIAMAAVTAVTSGMGGQAAETEYGGHFTARRIANLRRNVDSYKWARRERDAAVNAAAYWAGVDDETLWHMIPGQKLPRCIDVTMLNAVSGKPAVHIHQCPECGDRIVKHGNYPYNPDFVNRPWKLTCPECGAVFPKNDFGAYYASGIDETGCFDPERADRSLLFNADHPDPADPLHMYGVDDGFGWTDRDGLQYRFIGYYVWKYWGFLKRGLMALSNAYLYTGDPVYARKAAIMLDRVADVYPDMDWAPYANRGWYHSDGGSRKGKIEGRIWETGTVSNWALAYDMARSGFADCEGLYSFLKGMGERYSLPTGKGTYDQLRENIETRAIGAGVQAIFDGIIRGNEGMYQRAVVQSAVAVNREPVTGEWIDWIFREGGRSSLTGGNIPGLILGEIDRDGVGAEGSPGYSLGWSGNLGQVADWLATYDGYTKNDIYRDFPMFKKTISAGWNLAVLGANTPNIGDCGATGTRGIVKGDPEFIVRGYRYTKDPAFARIAAYAAKGRIDGLGRDILAEDPDWVEKDMRRILDSRDGEFRVRGSNRAGYGLVSVEFGPRNTGHALWMYYGRNGGHGHLDRLNFGIDAFGFCMTPDLGYPEYATRWAKRSQWTDNTISHNTVVVDELPQSVNWVGHPAYFAHFDDFGAFCVDSPEVYPGRVTLYERSMAQVDAGGGNAYTVDVFRVRGGSDHLMSFHTLPGDVTVVSGLDPEPQNGGSYAGVDVPWKESPWKGARTGYAWLNDVRRDTTPGRAYVVDVAGAPGYRGLTAGDNLHLRYHMMSDLHDVALAKGYPPSNKQGNPDSLPYILSHRAGRDGLASTFVSVVEPYRQTPVIREARRLAVECDDPAAMPAAVRVELSNGDVDVILTSAADNALCRTEDGTEYRGRLATLRLRGDSVIRAWLVRCASVKRGDFSVDAGAPGYRGRIVRLDDDMTGHGFLWVDTPLPVDGSLAGAEIVIANDRKRNAVYRIASVERDGNLFRIDCGDVSFIRGFKDPADYGQGYVTNFQQGAEWIIPNAISVDRR
jgi:hypothetical protein